MSKRPVDGWLSFDVFGKNMPDRNPLGTMRKRASMSKKKPSGKHVVRKPKPVSFEAEPTLSPKHAHVQSAVEVVAFFSFCSIQVGKRHLGSRGVVRLAW